MSNALTASITSLEISGIQTQIVGTTSDVPGSGTSANYDPSTVVGDYAVFDISSEGSAYGQLKVTFVSDNGSNIGSNIMIARTTNSQNLTDAATLSVLALGDNLSFDIRFDWYTSGSFIGATEQVGASLLSHQVQITSLDIDYNQFNLIQNSEFESITTNAGSNLFVTDQGATTLIGDNGNGSNFNDPNNAASYLTIEEAVSQSFTLGKQELSLNEPALFMFEFRSPSEVAPFGTPEVTAVPEPSSTSLLLLGSSALLLRRKRK
ncbi:MAG: PEP-CTERM sorting domain-containing protein [Rubritalea sp.]